MWRRRRVKFCELPLFFLLLQVAWKEEIVSINTFERLCWERKLRAEFNIKKDARTRVDMIYWRYKLLKNKEWRDAKLTWDPDEYGGVGELMVPSEHIWLPDIVLYNK